MADWEKQCRATFPGVVSVDELDGTDVHGISPSTFIINMYPQQNPPKARGDLVVWQGNSRVTFKNCLIDSASYVRNQGGQIIQCTIRDERWKWTRGYVISGRYNIRLPDNTVDAKREKKPIEIVELLFEAMEVSNYDASLVRNDPDISGSRPSVDWDVASPAQELQRLLDSFGLSICPNRKTGKFVVVRSGEGKTLPETYPYEDISEGVDPEELPDALMFVGAPIKYQVRLKLEAVTREIVNPNGPFNATQGTTTNPDGSVKPIDDATYKPSLTSSTKSWAGCDEEFETVSNARIEQVDGSYQVAREIARQWMYRAFRVEFPAAGLGEDNPLAIDQFKDPTDGSNTITRHQLILTAELAEKFVDPDGTLGQKSAFCDFVGTHKLLDEQSTNTLGGTRLDRVSDLTGDLPSDAVTFSINTEEPSSAITSAAGCVFFSEQLKFISQDSSGNDVQDDPAKVWLNCAIIIKDKKTDQPIRFTKILPLPGSPPLREGQKHKFVLPIRQDDVQLWYKTAYKVFSDDGEVQARTFSSNIDEANQQADYYLNAKLKEFELLTGKTISYPHLRDTVQLDGAIRQITYSFGPNGCNTRASRNSEHDMRIPSYRESLLIAKRNRSEVERKEAEEKASKKGRKK